MCLFANIPKAQRVRRPITCYKSVYHDKKQDGNGSQDTVFCSAFQDFEYKLGHAYYEPAFEREVPYCVVSYGFHSHGWEKVAEDESKSCFADVMLECRIPAGAMYYRGDTRDNTDLCSDIIVITAWKYPYNKEWHRVRTGIVIKPFLLRASDRLRKYVKRILKRLSKH